jgi:RHS repeat-associated protein
VTVTDSHGDTVTDSDGFAGMLLESIVYDGAGTGNQVTDTIDLPAGTTTGTDSNTKIPSVMANYAVDETFTTLAGGGTRESTESYTYNSYGQVATDSKVPDTSNPAEDTCTTYTYAVNTSTGLVDLPATKQVVDLPCGTTPTQASQLVSYTANTYDNGASSPTAGNLTKVQQATSATVEDVFGDYIWQYTYGSTDSYTYDEYGRPLTATDADNRTTSTAYTPATGAEPTSVQVTDPAGLVTTTTYDPARDVPLTVTDPAEGVTAKVYDALGRVTSSWTPGNPASGPAVDTYTYTTSNTAPSVVTEQTEQPGGGYLTSETLFDSMGQVRENQQETAGGGTDVTDTAYDSDGWKALVSDPYYVTGAPSGTLVAAASSSVPSQTGYVYDGAGRVIRQIAYARGTETWETDTSYGGNYDTVVPPAGGNPKKTFTDGRGLTTAIYQYHSGVPASPSDPAADYDQTSYTYTPAGQLATIKDATGNTWSYTYDLLGNRLTQSSPDAGTTTSTYDNTGQLMSVTDARGKQVSYTYDADGRKTAEYDTTGGAAESSATELDSWTYDTLAKGKLTSSTAYQNGASYTEAVTGYNAYELPTGSQTVIPSAQGALASTYTTSYTYAPTGQVTSYTDAAAGGLPAETVSAGFDAAGNPDSLTGASTYVNSLSYTNLGQPLQYTMGTSAEPVYITDTWDPQTGRLTEEDTQTTTAQVSVDDLHYSYDDVGDITAEADTPSGASYATDVQCFQYDYLGRLVQAWAQGSTGCASTPSASAEGGTAPYWQSYTYNTIGDLTGITYNNPGGLFTAAGTYPAAGSARPHAITAATMTSSSGTASYTYGYDAAGNLTATTNPSQSQALTWNDAGELTQDAVTPAGGAAQDTSYIYDASGTLLVTTDPGTTTLYLGDEELSLNTSTGVITGTRFYTLNGTTRRRPHRRLQPRLPRRRPAEHQLGRDRLRHARRHPPLLRPLRQLAAKLHPQLPGGNERLRRGASDTATGLTDLGAREYQPQTGSFISPDPILKPYDPQDLNPYAYAQGNPSTYSDPNGNTLPGGGQCGVGPAPKCNPQPAPAPKPKPRGAGSPPVIQISPHVYCSVSAAVCENLQSEYDFVTKNFGGNPAKNAKDEFNDWVRVCDLDRAGCVAAGLETAFVNGATPEYGTLDAWNHGLALLASAAGVVPILSDPVYAYLVQAIQKAWSAFDNGDIGFSQPQEDAIRNDQSLFKTYLGTVLDNEVKNIIKIDARNGNPIAQYLDSTGPGKFGADIINALFEPNTASWYDITTDSPAEQEHLPRYTTLYGPDGKLVPWNVIVEDMIGEDGGDGGDVDGGE